MKKLLLLVGLLLATNVFANVVYECSGVYYETKKNPHFLTLIIGFSSDTYTIVTQDEHWGDMIHVLDLTKTQETDNFIYFEANAPEKHTVKISINKGGMELITDNGVPSDPREKHNCQKIKNLGIPKSWNPFK